MSNELQPFPTPRNRAERRASARRIAAAGSAAVLASAAGSAVVMFTGGPAGAAPTDVTTCADSGAGSLRAAVLYAEGHTGPDTITITASCTASGPVDVGSVMNVTDPLTIVGPGPDQFVLDGDLSTNFFAVAYNADFSVSGVTMQNGFGANGGAVSVANGNDLSFTNVVFRDNVGAYTGGAVTIKFSHDITITSSRFEDNQTYLNGGAVYLNDTSGDVVISNSTFSGNDAGGSGGAIFLLEQPGTLGIYNSTLTGNTAGGGGAAAFIPGLYGDGTFLFNTIADNEGSTDDGFYILYASGRTLTFGGNIVASADNETVIIVDPSDAVVSYDNDFFGTVSGFTPAASDLNVDPQLQPLADNGGPTPTRALAATSPVVDLGPTAWTTFAGDGFDQRGTPYTRVSNGRSDMGAYELQVAPGPTPEPTPEPRFTG